ncbi:MAG: zinc-binding alcohol dehydrogenase [Cyanobacteria bacterium QH_8_48_120]|nr:MAG: zinc-binding alcohol dehydrogenase [Cyanobacteria bacterium QH_8_48_120]
MKAVIFHQYGDTEVLQYADVEKPQIKSDQLLVKVYASSVNPIDWKIRKGMLKVLTGNRFPMVLGFDVSGEVVELGEKVTHYKKGDLIYAHLAQLTKGTYAEYAAVSAQAAAFKPNAITHEQAAATPLAALTALQAFRDQGKIQQGQKVLINGASGGVGTFAVQIAKVMGAEVTGVCSEKNLELVKTLGADSVIDYTQQEFTKDVAKYDIIFDVVGDRSLSQCKQVLQPQGVYITTQPTPASLPQIFFTLLSPGQKAKLIVMRSSGKDLQYLKNLIEVGKVRPVIDQVYPLSEVAAAHAYSEHGHAVGKIAISVAS